MVWAAFSGHRKSPLILIEKDSEARRGGVTGRVYLRMLQEQLPSLCLNTTVFLQDNAPMHTYTLVRQWLADNGITAMDWPPYSPDLNPIRTVGYL